VFGLFVAFVLGTLIASLFLTIFYSASRLATAAERDSEARARRLTKSRVAREMLAKGLREQPPASAVSAYWVAPDLAGTIKGLPKELAGNPKYMRGLGE
jgi:hypothetical protein